MLKKDKLTTYILITLIILGIFLRFYSLGEEYLWDDEQLSMVSAIKIHRQDLKSGIMYFQEHPGLGKWLVALPSNFISANYQPLSALGPNMFAWSFLAHEALSANYVAIRIINAIIGTLAVFFVYLITKELFNKKAALWGAAIMATAPDMIAYSRHEVLMKIISIAMVLGTIYFYIKYHKEKVQDKKWIYLGAAIVFMVFALGSRNFDPLFIMPTIIISQFLLKRGKSHIKENLIVAGLVALSFIFVFFYTYPPEAKTFAQEHLEAESPFQLIGFTFLSMAELALIRNSYLTTISIILIFISLIYYLNKINKKDEKSALENIWIYLKDQRAVLVIFLLVSFIGIGLTRLGSGSMYNITFYSTSFLLAGIVVYKLTEKYQIIKYIFLAILIINIAQIIPNFPYSTWEYSNLGLGSSFYENKIDKTIPDTVFYELEIMGNPPITTSVVSALIFYKGEKKSMAVPNEARCTREYFIELIKANPLILHRDDIAKDQYICQLYKQLPLKEIKNFENRVYLYKIDQSLLKNE